MNAAPADRLKIVVAKWPRRGFTGIWLGAESFTLNAFGLPTINLTRQEWLVLAALVAVYPARINRSDLHEHLYGIREDGGPFDDALFPAIYRLRSKIAVTGILIKVVYRFGWAIELPRTLVPYAGMDVHERPLRRAA